MTRYKHFKPTEEQLVFLRQDHPPTMTQPRLRELFKAQFGIELSSWKMFHVLKKNGITLGLERMTFEKEHLDFLRKHYPTMSRKELLEAFNSHFEVNLDLNQLGRALKKNKIQSGRTGRFEAGSESWKLVKTHRPNSGTFRAGSIPANTKPLWTERVDDEGYIQIKVPLPNPYTKAKTRYMHKHVYVWEQANGPVPEGMVILFKDGNRQNCELDNLTLVSKAERLRLTQLHYREVPEEYRPLLLTVAKLDVKAFSLRKGNTKPKEKLEHGRQDTGSEKET